MTYVFPQQSSHLVLVAGQEGRFGDDKLCLQVESVHVWVSTTGFCREGKPLTPIKTNTGVRKKC